MRVLIAAYACQPGRGSEQGAGWNIVTQLARRNQVWVVVRSNDQTDIETEMVRRPIPNLHFVYHDVPWLLPLKRLPGGLYLYHYIWHLALRRLATELHHRIGFDVSHHLTLGSFRYPSGLAHLGIPLVIGPIGGAEETPLALWGSFGWRGALIESMRWLSNRAALLDPLVRNSYRKAAFVLPVTRHTMDHLSRLVTPDRMVLLPQSGVDPQALPPSDGPRLASELVRVLFVARLIHWKGSDLAVRAVAAAVRQYPAMTLTVLGTGPQERRLRNLIDRLDLGGCVRMISRVESMQDVYHLYREHDIFLFPSLHESGGMAVLEAMAAGLPIVCLDLGGPGVSVTEECGVTIPPTTTRQVSDDMATALVKLALDPELRQMMGDAGRRRVAGAYAWETKADRISEVYRRLAP